MKAHNVKPYQSLDDAFDEAIRETKDELAGKIVRLPTGFPELDRIIYGLEKGRLYCIAAEEKIGKSLFSYQVALHNAMLKKPVGLLSLEMRSPEIAKRFAGINSGQQAEKRLQKLVKRKCELEQLPLYIRDGSLTESSMFTVIHKLVAEKQIELLVVDYLQLVQMQERHRVNEINNVVIHLKGLAMELNIPVILVAAVLNKQINGRSDRKPKPSDIRDTGRLANDADCTMFLWKPDEQDDDYLELFVACSRYSSLGKIGLRLDRTEVRLGETLLREPGNNSISTFNYN